MSYCRFGDTSDVYLYLHVNGFWHCCGCAFDTPECPTFDDLQDVLIHLEAHIEAGHLVPEYALDRVKEELAQEIDE